MNSSNGFNGLHLFIDLDDVLVDSHNNMNADLVAAYGPQYDWARTTDCQNKVKEHLEALAANHGLRAKRALEGIKRIRDMVARYGMRYSDMQAMFNEVNSYQFDINYSEEENGDFHDHLNRITKYFILRERILDARDTKLFEDNHLPFGEHAVHYENYYTKQRLLANPKDRDKPQVVDALAQEPIFGGDIKILSHYNGPNEGNAKQNFCQDCYPNATFTPLFFHENNKFNKDFRRPRYSKAKFVKEELKLDVKRSILIDDSKDNIDAWVSAGGIAIWYTQDPKNNETDKYYVLRNFTYEEIMGIVSRIANKYQIPMNQLQQNTVNTNQPKGKILTK